MVKLNAEESPATARFYGVSSLPTDVIITPAGKLVSQLQSPPTANQYVVQMNQAAAGYRALMAKPETPAAQPQAPVQTAGGAPPTTYEAVPASMAAPGTPPAAAQSPPAGDPGAVTVAANQVPPSQTNYSDDRYSDYFRQHPNAAPPANPQAAPAQTMPQQGAAQTAGYAPAAAARSRRCRLHHRRMERPLRRVRPLACRDKRPPTVSRMRRLPMAPRPTALHRQSAKRRRRRSKPRPSSRPFNIRPPSSFRRAFRRLVSMDFAP